MNDELLLVGFGVFIGVVVGVLLTMMPFSDAYKYKEIKAKCEAVLPRDKQCLVVGVPQ
jgi:uncharacterized membrane protein YgaE (UPF0421/DUF939 family)